MPTENPQILEIIGLLKKGTQKDTIRWEAETPEADSFYATLGAGQVRLSRIVNFSSVGSGFYGVPTTTPSPRPLLGPVLIEFLDNDGRSLLQYQTQTSVDVGPGAELFALVLDKALNLNKKVTELMEELRQRSN
jgi:hypothetical protein